jgi:hypothetical protein
MFSQGKYGGIHMGKKIRVILRNGLELTYEDARVVEGKKTWIYQVSESEYPEELLALIDPFARNRCPRKGDKNRKRAPQNVLSRAVVRAKVLLC